MRSPSCLLGPRARVVCLVILALAGSLPTLASAATASDALDPLLTDAERAWLAEHDRATIALDGHFPPYSFRDDDGSLAGLAVDIVDLLSERTGLELEPWSGGDTWVELYEAAQARDVDIVGTMVERPERHEWFAFTRPYISKSLVVMTRSDDPRVTAPQNLAGLTVALVRDYQYSARVLEEYPTIEPLWFDTMVDALHAVSTEKADAAISFLGGGHFLRTRHLMTNLRFAAIYDRDTSAESIAVRSDWPELAAVLDKALTTVTSEERLALDERWLPDASELAPDPAAFALTPAEQRWVDAHPVIRLGVDPEFHPYEFVDADGLYRGMAADLVALLNERTGLNMTVVEGLTWDEVIDRAERREGIDVLPAVGMTEERRAWLRFSQPWVRFNRVIITRTDFPFLGGLADLESLRVAVQESSSHEGFLADHTSIEPTTYPTLQEAVLSVANGETDALVGNLASTAYWIRSLTIGNLKVAGAASEATQGLHLAVRSDWPELVGILDRGLAAITPAEHAAIEARWVALQFDPERDYGPLARVIAIALGLLLLAAAWVWTARLQTRRVEAARAEAEAARLIAEHANAELQRLRDHLEELVAERTVALTQSEERFRQAQKMEALGTLVGGIAHDFNNLLSGVLGSVYLARTSEEGGGADAAMHFDNAEVLCMRGASMIDQLLTFARKGGVEKEVLLLNDLVDEARTLVRSAVRSNIRIEVTPCPTPLWVCGSHSLLLQAVFNLVINARDALEGVPDPRIELRMRAAEEACVEVIDNGSGIDAATRDRLFDPFFTTKAPGQGTGLGLAMVYGTVLDHEGEVEVDSTPGEGSCFRIRLPRVPAPAVRPEADEVEAVARGQGQWVLVADDDEHLREIYASLLVRLGYEVRTVADGRLAVDELVASPGKYSLALLDGVMPRLTGPAAARRLKALQPDLKVVVMTGYGAFPDSGDDGWVDAVLRKPVRASTLSRVLHAQLQSNG